uniref:Uncharacterized protein n=1 Tax=Aegilops tauschii subsp. strangulata TaxID=200361 RepID=A0A452ZW47_AEGTS
MWNPLWVLRPWLLLLLLQLAIGSMEAVAPSPPVPSFVTNPLLRTGYHFQPPKNWINGNLLPRNLSDCSPAC